MTSKVMQSCRIGLNSYMSIMPAHMVDPQGGVRPFHGYAVVSYPHFDFVNISFKLVQASKQCSIRNHQRGERCRYCAFLLPPTLAVIHSYGALGKCMETLNNQ